MSLPNPDDPLEGQYNPLRGAGAYAPIVSTFGGFSIAALVFMFVNHGTMSPQQLQLGAGLLVITVLGCIVGSFGLAGISAERDLTANMPAGIIHFAVPISVGMISLFSAFDVLADAYLQGSSWVFYVAVALVVLFSILLTSAVIGESHAARPYLVMKDGALNFIDDVEFEEWNDRQWLKSRTEGYAAMRRSMATSLLSVAALVLISHLVVPKPRLTTGTANWFVALGLTLSVFFSILGVWRTIHPTSGRDQRGLTRQQVCLCMSAVVIYSSLMLIVLPPFGAYVWQSGG